MSTIRSRVQYIVSASSKESLSISNFMKDTGITAKMEDGFVYIYGEWSDVIMSALEKFFHVDDDLSNPDDLRA